VRQWVRRLLTRIFGAPVCAGCLVHGVDCVGWCHLSDAERVERYVRGQEAKSDA
jgi:hypothetical protein